MKLGAAHVSKKDNFPVWEIIKRMILTVTVFDQIAFELNSEPDTLSISCSLHPVSSLRSKFTFFFLISKFIS